MLLLRHPLVYLMPLSSADSKHKNYSIGLSLQAGDGLFLKFSCKTKFVNVVQTDILFGLIYLE